MGRQSCPMEMSVPMHAETWIARIFAAKSAHGQVVRRNRDWVTREIGVGRLMEEVRGRGYHLIQTDDQFVVIRLKGEIRVLF